MKGTLYGVAYTFTGAAACYFAIFVALMFTIRPQLERQADGLARIATAQENELLMDKFEIWHVTGQVTLENAAAPVATGEFKIRMVPPPFQVQPGGYFQFDIPVRCRRNVRTFPDLVFEHEGYAGFSLFLGPKESCTFGHKWVGQAPPDQSNASIHLTEPIVLPAPGPYFHGDPPPPLPPRTPSSIPTI